MSELIFLGIFFVAFILGYAFGHASGKSTGRLEVMQDVYMGDDSDVD